MIGGLMNFIGKAVIGTADPFDRRLLRHDIDLAYHYAPAVESIARSGSEEYPLPMFVNAWLEQFPWNTLDPIQVEG